MKKTYLQPAMMVVTLQQQSIICASPVSDVSSNADMGYGGGGSGPARAPITGGLRGVKRRLRLGEAMLSKIARASWGSDSMRASARCRASWNAAWRHDVRPTVTINSRVVFRRRLRLHLFIS